MGRLARFFAEAIGVHMTHFRRCSDCAGRGWTGSALCGPDGRVPVRAVVAQIQCGACKGKGRTLIGEQVTERGRTRAWERGRLIDERAAGRR